jgi:hypothetical protein
LCDFRASSVCLASPGGASNGAPVNSGNLRRRVLKPAAEEACVEWVGFHAFRHTCASLLFAEGRNAKQVQVRLGHHSAAFTLATYVHLLDGDLGEPLDLARVMTEAATDPIGNDPTTPETDPAEVRACWPHRPRRHSRHARMGLITNVGGRLKRTPA